MKFRLTNLKNKRYWEFDIYGPKREIDKLVFDEKKNDEFLLGPMDEASEQAMFELSTTNDMIRFESENHDTEDFSELAEIFKEFFEKSGYPCFDISSGKE